MGDHALHELRARVRMWLRGERAFGLDALPVVVAEVQPPPVEPIHPPDGPADPPPGAGATPATRPRRAGAELAPCPAPAPAEAALDLGLLPPSAQEPFAEPVLPSAEKRARLLALEQSEVRGCTRCRLCQSRTHTVFGEGDPDATIFFIGEGPGETEDRTGRPFVGRAGELLDRMIQGMGLQRGQVYIANIVKCRPPGNREPAPDEVATCTPYLVRQIEIVRPRVIVTLGRPATQYMLGQKVSISKLRGHWQTWRGIRLMPTFHPAYILRQYTPATRAAVWSDLKQVMLEVGLPLPVKNRAQEV